MSINNTFGTSSNKIAHNNSNDTSKAKKNTDGSFASILDKAKYLDEPERSEFNSAEEFYEADNKYVKKLLENPNALPDTGVEGYKLTRPTEGVSRSTDVYSRKIDDNMLKFLDEDGDTVWQVFVPNLNWHKTNTMQQDAEVGDAYSRNISRYAAKTIFKRGESADDQNPVLDGVAYDGGKAYREFQSDLYNQFNKMYADYFKEQFAAEMLDKINKKV
ncbi:MAG: hypothetical protein FH758_06050 [Firmicutes bacterium]|nr:hypothetical protein [Bacillota bacterium]